MFEKLLLAVTITLSLNLFLQIRGSNQTNTHASYHQPTILVRMLKK